MEGEAPLWLLVVLAAVGLIATLMLSAGEAALGRITLAAGDDLEHLSPKTRRKIQSLIVRAPTAVPAAAFGRVLAEVIFGVATTLALVQGVDEWAALGWGTLAAIVAGLAVAAVRPRARGRADPAGTLRWTGPLLRAFDVMLRPLRGMLRSLTPAGADMLSAEQLADLVENIGTTSEIDEEDREMLSAVVELGQTLTREVMVPRTDVVAIDHDQPLRKAMALFLRSGHSRVPVVGEGGLDDALGVAYLKDTALVLQARPGAKDDPISEVMRPALFVPESKPADDLLRELQTLGTHIALVVDEYGGVAGLVTMEDLLEEIVGELTDEHDPAPLEAEPLGDGVYRVPARLELDELGELFDREVDDDDVDTVGGLLAKAVGRVPIAGSQGEVDGIILTAERTEGRRKQLSTVLVRLAPRPVEGEDEE
jgi:CBS domain containing-hemolysin-like protein